MKKHLFALIVLTMTLVSWNALAPTDVSAAPSQPQILTVTYCWQMSYNPACPQQDLLIHRSSRYNGTVSATAPGSGNVVGTWTLNRRTNTFVMNFPSVGVTYTGTKRGDCYVNGTMTGPQFGGSWEGCFTN